MALESRGFVTSIDRRGQDRLFPLHLAPIDAFFLADDSVAYPMSSFIRFEFFGELLEEPFRQALQQALLRHPLVQAVVRPAKRRQPCWVLDPHVAPMVDWGHGNSPVNFQHGEYVDLRQECGVRFWVRVGNNRSTITMQVHHASTDGTGVYRFVGDLLAIYGILTTTQGELPRLTDLRPELLKHRRRKMARLALRGEFWTCLRKVAEKGIQIFGNSSVPIATKSGRARPVSQPPVGDYHSVTFDVAEHQQLRERAADHGAMMNDLILAEAFRSVIRWNDTLGHPLGRRPLRIMMPFDMRDQRDYAMPAANLTAYTFLSRKASECADAARLIASIRDETGRIKNGDDGTDFIDAVMIANSVPGILPILLKLRRCLATLTLSNVGDPSKRFLASFPRSQGRIVCGNVVLDDVTGVPPLRPLMRGSIAVFSYRRKLTLCLRCDPHTFTANDAQSLIEHFALGLRSYLVAVSQSKIA